jgi:hypothetical protein
MKLLIHRLMMVLLLVAVGCSRKAAPSVTAEVMDSTFMAETARTVEVRVPGDTVEILKYIECDSNTNKPKPFIVEKKKGRATSRIEVKATGQLVDKCTCDSLRELTKVMDRTIYHLRRESRSETTPIYQTRKSVKVLAWIGVLSCIGFIFLIFRKLNKFFNL